MTYDSRTGSWTLNSREKAEVIAALEIDGRAFTMDEVIFVEREIGVWSMWFKRPN